MGIIPQTKTGNCSRCSANNTACIKRGKNLLCLRCAQAESTKKYIETAAKKNHEKMLLNSISEPEPFKSPKSEAIISQMDAWFDTIGTIIKAKPYCMECGEWIPDRLKTPEGFSPTKKFYHAATAHIFPKAVFESVKTHPLNFLILGAGCCHNKSHSIETFKKMKVFPVAVQRYLKFMDLITEGTKYQDLFEQAAIERGINI